MMSQPVLAELQVQAPSSLPIYHNFKRKQAWAMGIIQIMMGVGSIAVQSAAIHVAIWYNHPFRVAGIYFGIIFILAGSFGLASARAKTSCLIATCMVFSVMSAGLTGQMLSASAIRIREEVIYYHGTWDTYDDRYILNAALVVISIIEAIAAIWASALCCQVVCCGRIQNQPGCSEQAVYYSAAGHVAAPQMVMDNQRQPCYTQQGGAQIQEENELLEGEEGRHQFPRSMYSGSGRNSSSGGYNRISIEDSVYSSSGCNSSSSGEYNHISIDISMYSSSGGNSSSGGYNSISIDISMYSSSGGNI